jgi:DNA-binding transcriptional LysR family regulator
VGRVLDIVPLRSLIAVADMGGFHRAAASLHLSQPAVSQHLRRLERVLGKPLVQPDGRRARLTSWGEALLAEARQIVAAHDEALQRLEIFDTREITIGATEHAADQVLPPIMAALAESYPDLQVKFRFDRTLRLNDAVSQGSVDLAIFITEASIQQGTKIGSLPLVWCAASGWTPPPPLHPWPLLAIEEPRAIRRSALAVLAEHGIRTKVVGEAAYLAGVLNAVRAGLGVTLLALAGPPPEGLTERSDLPAVPPISVVARARPGADTQVTKTAIQALQRILSAGLAARGGVTRTRSRGHRTVLVEAPL